MNFKKRVKAIFAKPEHELMAVLPKLQQLRRDLQFVLESRDPLTDIVSFFDNVSRWHDRGIEDVVEAFEEVNYGQYDEVLEKLRTLQKHFVNAGRDKYGWNRTEHGAELNLEEASCENASSASFFV